MHLVYGFEAPISNAALPYAHLIVDILHEWPEKSTFIKHVIEYYGGTTLFITFECDSNRLCQLCQQCPTRDRQNLHRFMSMFHTHFANIQFRIRLELVKFVTAHGSALFEKKSLETDLHPHLRLKYK